MHGPTNRQGRLDIIVRSAVRSSGYDRGPRNIPGRLEHSENDSRSDERFLSKSDRLAPGCKLPLYYHARLARDASVR